jgi:hypothetical protein
MIMLLAQLLLAADPEPVALPNISLGLYTSCAKVEAKALEPSGEPATVVAEVVVSKCEPLLGPAYDEWITMFRERPEVKSFESNGRTYVNYAQVKPQVLDSMRSALRKVALEAVVETRAARARR